MRIFSALYQLFIFYISKAHLIDNNIVM